MIWMFVTFGVATIWLFLLYSQKVGSVLNAVTIYVVMKVVIEFVLEPLAYSLNLFSYDFRSIFLIYLLSFLGYAAFIIGLLITKQQWNPLRTFSRSGYLSFAWVLLAAAWLFYAPVIIEFRDMITEPRRIYELTRTGYGIYTFGSALLSFLSYIVFLMSTRKRQILFYLVIVLLMALKGSKGQFVVLISIAIIARVYLRGFKYSLTKSAIYGSITGVMLLYLFAFNYRGQIDNVFITIAEYSDYNRNGAFVLQDDTAGQYNGIITLETLWIPKIPRAIWPDKPKMFGEFRLAMQYYPKWFLQDQGSPSFGIGMYFADFKWFAFLVYPLLQFLSGYLLGLCLNRLIVNPNVFYFVVSVYLSGSNLLSTGGGFYLVEHAVIGVMLMAMLGFLGVGRHETTGLQGGRRDRASPLGEALLDGRVGR